MKTTKLFLLALLAAMTACQEYVPVDTYAEPEDPVAMTEEQVAEWSTVDGLNAAWGDADYRYSRSRSGRARRARHRLSCGATRM